jgi:hypothetical protein
VNAEPIEARLRRPEWRLSGLLGLAAIMLWPALGAGYMFDDIYNSLRPGMLIFGNDNIFDLIPRDMRGSMLQGRFFPLVWLWIDSIYYCIQNLFIYRLFITGAVLLDLFLFWLLVRRTGGESGLACFAATLTIMLFQFRAFFDPVLGFQGQLQIVAAGLLFSLLALEKYLEKGGKRWLVLSAVSYLLCNLMYEISYIILLIHLLLIWRSELSRNARLLIALPFVQAAGICVFLTLLLRWLHPDDNHYIHKISLNPKDVLLTLARQTSAALPLSYFLADPAGLFQKARDLPSLAKWVCKASTLPVFIAALAVSYASLQRRPAAVERGPAGKWTLLFQIGLLLLVLPGILIAISLRYQGEVTVGKGYLPVFLQYFGAGLLLASGFWLALTKVSAGRPFAWWSRLTVAVLVAATTSVTYCANCATVRALMSPPGTPYHNIAAAAAGLGTSHFQRLNLEAALHAGLMENVPADSVVHLENEYTGWHDSPFCLFFYAMHTSKRMAVIPPSAKAPSLPSFEKHKSYLATIPAISKGAPFCVRDVCLSRKSGFVVLAQLNTEPGSGESSTSRDLRLFVRHPRLFGAGSVPRFLLTGDWLPCVRASGCGSYARPGGELPLVRSGPDWGLFSLRAEVDQVDPNSLSVEFDPARAARRVALIRQPDREPADSVTVPRRRQ